MNKTKIEWCDYTWNPVTGCLNNCWYCYARKMAVNNYYKKGFSNKFEPSFYRERLEEPLKINKPSRIFVCSMADLFGDWVYNTWIYSILEVVRKCPQHTFMFLTKNPKRYKKFDFPDNCWLGVTITKGDAWNFPMPGENIKFVSCEPLLGGIDFDINYPFDWVIIGALTGHGKKYQPRIGWVKNIVTQANFHNIPIFMKNNLKGIWDDKLRQEFPK